MKKLFIVLCALLQVSGLYAYDVEHVEGFMWKVENEGNTVYLLGSIHMAKEDLYPLPGELEQAFSESDALVLEIDIRKVNAMLMMSSAVYQDGSNLRQALSDSSFNVLWNCAREMNITDSLQFIKFRPWMITMTLLQGQLAKLGYTAEYGIDQHFLNKASAKEMEVLELETFEMQIGLFEKMDEFADAYVYYTMKEMENLDREMEKMFEYWREGDAENMDEYMRKSMDLNDPDIKEIYESMFTIRNKNMTEKIEVYLTGADRKTYFVVVGSGHIVGDGGIIDLLVSDED